MQFKNYTLAPCLLIVIIGLSIFFNVFYHPQGGSIDNALIGLVIYLLPAVFYLVIKGRSYIPSLRLRVPKPLGVGLTISGAVLLIAGYLLIKTLKFRMTGSIYIAGYDPEEVNLAGGSLYILIAYILIPAFCEEFVFRGIILTEYDVCGPFISCIVSSFLFAIVHIKAESFALYFYLGMILAIMTYVSGSVFPAIAAHALNNLFAIYGNAFLGKVLGQPQNMIISTFVLVVIFLLMLIAMLYSIENIYIRRGNENTPSPVIGYEDSFLTRLFQAVLAPTFLICTAIIVALNMLNF